MIGPMEQHIYFVLFDATTPSGHPLADPLCPGKLSLHMMGESHDWRLPLGSLLPKKECPVGGGSLHGAWEYCPRHGMKLRLP
jgi:hypothetical protein